MARGKSIPPLIRTIILREHADGLSQAEIARGLGLNRQTVHRVIQIERDKAARDAD